MKKKEIRKEPELSFKEKMGNAIIEGERQYNLNMEFLRKSILPILEEVSRNMKILISENLNIENIESLNYFELIANGERVLSIKFDLDDKVYLLHSDFLFFERTKNINGITDYVLRVFRTKSFGEFVHKNKK